MGSHRPSSQPAPTGAKPRTDSTYKRGQFGEQVSLSERSTKISQRKLGASAYMKKADVLAPMTRTVASLAELVADE
jgi:hypothetical protein